MCENSVRFIGSAVLALTELYAAETFMFVLENGLNTVTGDPRLKRERLLQMDLGPRYDSGSFRAGITGFHGWAWDYITFENVGVFPPGAPQKLIQQIQLEYVNTGSPVSRIWATETTASTWTSVLRKASRCFSRAPTSTWVES